MPPTDNDRASLWTKRRISIDRLPMRILIVDDNQNAANAISAYLTTHDFECREAFGGVEAIACAIAWRPDLIAMDISMPECNGFEAALDLRNDPRTRSISIIAFTALDELEVRRHLSDHEFDAYCQKGQSPVRLLALISKMRSLP
jgi:two-component system OmpR family response regulator